MDITITEDDFYKIIKDFRMMRKPQWIKEIILNAQIKLRQPDGRFVYCSFKPSGYIAAGEITYSAHSFGREGIRKLHDFVQSQLRRGS